MTTIDRSGPDPAALRAWAATNLERGRAAWPDLAVTGEELAAIAGLRLAEASARGTDLALDALDPAELWLAAACARGDAAALDRFRDRYFEVVAVALRRMGLDEADREDVWQTLCERLLVATDGAPARIVRYAGTGELPGLLKVAGTRVALNWLEREGRRRPEGDWLAAMPDTRSDPELHLLRDQHQTAFKEELAGALAALSVRDRAILRLHLVERVSIDVVAGLYAVHRATAARWITAAKAALATRVRERLAARLRVTEASLAVLRSLIDSRLDLSLERLLAAE